MAQPTHSDINPVTDSLVIFEPFEAPSGRYPETLAFGDQDTVEERLSAILFQLNRSATLLRAFKFGQMEALIGGLNDDINGFRVFRTAESPSVETAKFGDIWLQPGEDGVITTRVFNGTGFVEDLYAVDAILLPIKARLDALESDQAEIFQDAIDALKAELRGAASADMDTFAEVEAAIDALTASLAGGLAAVPAANITGVLDPARIPPSVRAMPQVSSGGVADLTIEQQGLVGEGSPVLLADGRVLYYKGTGSKTSEASYVIGADQTPAEAQIPALPISKISNLQTALDAKIGTSERGANNGVASLDSGGKVPIGQLPSGLGDGTILPSQYTAAGDGTTDDSSAWASLIAALQSGDRVEGEGKTYRIVTTLQALKASGAPDNVTIENCVFLADGGTSDHVFRVHGASVALTSVGTVAAGATTITATGASAGDAGKYIFLQSTDKTCDGKANSYLSGEMLQIRSVSGTTITIETPTKLAYTTGVTAELTTMIKGWRFINCKFIGSAAKTQGGVHFKRAENCYADTTGFNMGYATQYWEQSVYSEFRHFGGNPGITTDNGTDYGVVAGNGCVGLTGRCSGYEYRHVFAAGGTKGVCLLGEIYAQGESMKDAVLDAHPNVLALTAIVRSFRPRNGGVFSNQPVGLTWQGGGYLDADVVVDGYATSAILIQPHQGSAKDHIKIRGRAINPTSAATRGIEVDLYKAGGSIELLDIDFDAPGLTAAGSRGVNIDTNNCASGVSINTVRTRGLFEAVVYGAVLICRAGHSVVRAFFGGEAEVTTSGGFGWAMLGTSNNIASGKFECHTKGATGVKGVRADNVVHSTAVGCRALDVAGAALSTNAEVGITLSVGGSYT